VVLAALTTSLLWALSVSACAKTPATVARAPEEMVVRVIRSFPHDRRAFTQGLVFYEGKLYESTGLVGQSSLRQVDPESGKVERQVALDASLFAEGLARVGGRLFQITWQNGKALVWNLATFKKEREIPYAGEGWGLCHDGKRLTMSTGGDHLVFRDPETFAKQGEVAVRRAGQPLGGLNELECVSGLVYANVWQQNRIARIDPSTGEVTGWIYAGGLLTADEASGTDVLNGIAYLEDRGRFLITGKLWPRTFEVEFVPVGR
jgi:glutaminyl-peptide cyclotransferase